MEEGTTMVPCHGQALRACLLSFPHFEGLIEDQSLLTTLVDIRNKLMAGGTPANPATPEYGVNGFGRRYW